MWRKLSFISWYVIVGILVLTAIVISIVRGYPSVYQDNLQIIQEKISSIIDRPVRVESMHLEWHGFTPHITVNNLAIYSDDTKLDQILFAKKALLSIDVYKSLIQKKFNIHQLTLIGSNLEAVRTKDQRIILNGIDISERIAKRKKLNNKNEIRISLLESSIAIKDEVKNLDYFFDRVDILLGYDKDRFKVVSNFLLPETLGNSLILVADVKDFDQGLNHITGTLYAKGQNINLELISDFFPRLQVGIKTGNSDFEVWGNFKSSLERSFNGELNIRDLIYHDIVKPLKGIITGQEITALETKFQLEGTGDSWHLVLINSDIQAAGMKWSDQKYEINCTDCGKPDFSIMAALGYVDLTHLFSTLQHFPVFSSQLENLLAKVQISGELDATSILARWHDKQLAKYTYKTSLKNTTVSIPSQEFEVSSLMGKVKGNHLQGSMAIDAPSMNIQVNKLTDYSFQGQKIVGAVKWGLIDDGVIVGLENVFIKVEDISVNLQGSIQINNGIPYIDIQGEVPQAQVATIKKYLPIKKMRPILTQWLKESINGGTLKNVRLLFHGNPIHFPFKDQPGAFEAIANVEEGVLDYRKAWPSAHDIHADLIVKNNHLTVNGHQGMILNSSINQFTATIDDLKLPRLIIDGQASGPAGDILDYLQKSSLIPNNSKIPKHISAYGNTNLDLNIILTLTKKLAKERTINGEIEFDNTSLMVTTNTSLPFKDLNGKLKFNRYGAEGQGLSAKLFGSAFYADASMLEDGGTRLRVTGNFDVDAFTALHYQNLNKYIKGAAPITATIGLPRFEKHNGDKSLEINLDSDLVGISVALPEPFYKKIDEHKSISVHAKYQTGIGHPLFVSYDNKAFIQALYSEDRKQMTAMELRMGNDRFDLPAQGLKLSGKFDQLNLTEWQKLIQSPSEASALELSEIDIQADTISVSSLEFQNIDFKMKKDTQYWLGEINSSIANGKFSYPLDLNSNKIATGTFGYLRFSMPGKKISISLDPRKLPALQINTNQFEFNGYTFNDVALKTKPSTNGMTINSLTGKGKDLLITANGAWEVGVDEAHSTRLDIALNTQNLYNSLTGLGIETGVTKGQGGITAKLNWPNTPYQFSVDSFLGTANLRFKDGEISSVKPGAGRLIGLVNLREITRRLSLDFTDFYSKGYVFDKIRGDLVFKDANLTTENLSIKGPSANILIQGRTGIVAKDYDQVVTVTPHVSGGLPWIGLIFGGPLGAGGVIVAEKVAKSIGVDVNKVTELKYSMTGSWHDPKIEPIAQKVVKVNSSAQGQPSPQGQPSARGQPSPQPSPPN